MVEGTMQDRPEDDRPRVLISVPNTGWIHKHVTRSVIGCLRDTRYAVTYIDPTHKPYEANLNAIAKDVLDGEWDYWLNIDSDNPPLRNPLDLIELDRDVCGLPTPIYHNDGTCYPICWNALDRVEGRNEYRMHPVAQGEMHEVDAIGSGCMIVARRVIERVQPPWFVREVDEWGRPKHGPDFYFCTKAGAAGFRVWTHYGYPCRHFNEVELIEAMQAFAAFPAQSNSEKSSVNCRV